MLTIVLIEDDIAMRTLLSEWLENEGHVVRARASIGEHVLAGVDLVIVDLPATRDAEAVERVKALSPGAAVIGISARLSGAAAGTSQRAAALGLRRLVPKPCSRRELLEAVADTMEVAR